MCPGVFRGKSFEMCPLHGRTCAKIAFFIWKYTNGYSRKAIYHINKSKAQNRNSLFIFCMVAILLFNLEQLNMLVDEHEVNFLYICPVSGALSCVFN